MYYIFDSARAVGRVIKSVIKETREILLGIFGQKCVAPSGQKDAGRTCGGRG